MKNITLLLLLNCLLTLPLHASIEILRTHNATDNQCNGRIQMKAKSETEPFDGSLNLLNGNTLQIIESFNEFKGRKHFNGLCAGKYVIILTDQYGCEYRLETEVFNCEAITIENLALGITAPSGCSTADGVFTFSHSVSVEGGTSPYQIELFDAANNMIQQSTNSSWGNLIAGDYTFRVEDANGCLGKIKFNIEGSNDPIVEVDIRESCSGQTKGYIAISVFDPTDETQDYDFNWSTGHTTSSDWVSEIENLAAGNYTLTITSTDGLCGMIEQFTIDGLVANNPLTIGESVYQAECANDPSGNITLTVDGGVKPYKYNWSDNNIGLPKRYRLLPGEYCVTVTDYCGASTDKCINVYAAHRAVWVDAIIHPSNGLGSIEAFASGGDEQYTYNWSNGATTSTISDLETGSYSITVMDGQGCSVERSFFIQNCGLQPVPYADLPPLQLEAHLESDAQDCKNSKIKITTIAGSIPPYTIQIDRIENEQRTVFDRYVLNNYLSGTTSIEPNMRGKYEIIVYDACGNDIRKEFTICEYCGLDFEVENNEYIIGNGGLQLDVSCGCASGCNNFFVEVEGDEDRLIFQQDYTITWPDGQTTTVRKVRRSYPSTEYDVSISGPNQFDFNSTSNPNGPHQVTITRSDGCSINLEIGSGEDEKEVIIFGEGGIGNLQNYYIATGICSSCVPKTDYFISGEVRCSNGLDLEMKPFFYHPYDRSNPCSGGGRLQAYAIVNGTIQPTVFTIPPGVNITPMDVSGVSFGDTLVEGKDCANGGGCIFDAMDVYGFSLDKYLFVEYCNRFVPEGTKTTGNNTPPTYDPNDRDGDGIDNSEDDCPDEYDPLNFCDNDNNNDGIPDVDEEDICVEEIAIGADADCDLRIYCVSQNGVRTFLRMEEGPNIIPCKYTRNGSCEVKAYCTSRCRFDRINWLDYSSSTYPSDVYNCDDPNIETCEAVAASVNCFWDGISVEERRSNENIQELIKQPKTIVKVFPNPFNNEITIEIKHGIASRANIYNTLGKLMFTKEVIPTNSFTLYPNLSEGIYFVELVNSDGQRIGVQKIIKQRQY